MEYIWLVISYVAIAIPIYVVATKTSTDNEWMAFIPLLQLYLVCEIADKNLLWLVGLLLPVINILVWALLWMEIARSMDKPDWLGALMIVPLLDIGVAWYIAAYEPKEPEDLLNPSRKQLTRIQLPGALRRP
ncbi:MAG: hypothetical protein IT209_05755 [Armatimonadetes bacterium]|nr:hypothetical protein [Armatimonadota bacterium]